MHDVNQMKMRSIIFVSLMACGILSGCGTTHSATNTNGILANPISDKPTIMQTDPSKADYQLAYGNNAGVEKAYQEYLKTGKAQNIITQGFVQFAFGASQPVIDASPFELTVITLENGENVTNVSTGDPLRWSYSLAYAGTGKDRQAHVMVKPLEANISTNMVITTDKRMYTLKLVSTNSDKYLRNVKFWYTDEIQQYWDNYNAHAVGQEGSGSDPQSIIQLPNIHLGQLNFKYKINTPFFSSPRWTPIRAFDDGTHSYIEFPANIDTGDLPALFVVNSADGTKELVNYHVKKPYFIIDKIFKEAALILGVGHSQTKVSIINENL
jgi:P-type conjugative transfer protein TrbG